jgi:hypothetical protein
MLPHIVSLITSDYHSSNAKQEAGSVCISTHNMLAMITYLL